jgi:hypothetical protein
MRRVGMVRLAAMVVALVLGFQGLMLESYGVPEQTSGLGTAWLPDVTPVSECSLFVRCVGSPPNLADDMFLIGNSAEHVEGHLVKTWPGEGTCSDARWEMTQRFAFQHPYSMDSLRHMKIELLSHANVTDAEISIPGPCHYLIYKSWKGKAVQDATMSPWQQGELDNYSGAISSTKGQPGDRAYDFLILSLPVEKVRSAPSRGPGNECKLVYRFAKCDEVRNDNGLQETIGFEDTLGVSVGKALDLKLPADYSGGNPRGVTECAEYTSGGRTYHTYRFPWGQSLKGLRDSSIVLSHKTADRRNTKPDLTLNEVTLRVWSASTPPATVVVYKQWSAVYLPAERSDVRLQKKRM